MEEVQVLVSDASSEFGRSMGGTVNAVTRSGGNSFHGAGYGYLAKPTLSSAERYALGRSLFQKQNQDGGSLGGPVLPGKVFFFLNAEVLDGQFPGHEPHHQPDDRQFHRHLRSIVELQGVGDRMRSRNPVHPGANERGVAALPALGHRPGEDRLPPQRPQYLRRRGQRHEFALPRGRADRERGPRWGTAGHRQFQGRYPLRKGVLDQRADCDVAINEARFGMFEDRFSDPASQSNLSTGNAGYRRGGSDARRHPSVRYRPHGTAVPVGGQLQHDRSGALLEAGLRRVADPRLDQ